MFTRYLDFTVFVRSTDFKICDVINALLHNGRYTKACFFWILSTINIKFVKYYCAVGQTFLKCFWLNAGDWKLVAGPFMILWRWIYSLIWPFLTVNNYHFKIPLTFSKNGTLESSHNWLLNNWRRLLNWKGPGT